MVFLHSALWAGYTFVTHRVALRMKTALEALLYRKVVSLTCEAVTVTSPSAVLDQFVTSSDTFSGVSFETVIILLF
jgi:hypothetical protein